MSEINELLAKIAEPETPEERDAAWNEVADRLRLMDAMQAERDRALRLLAEVRSVLDDWDYSTDWSADELLESGPDIIRLCRGAVALLTGEAPDAE
jgi:hypothetical protein